MNKFIFFILLTSLHFFAFAQPSIVAIEKKIHELSENQIELNIEKLQNEKQIEDLTASINLQKSAVRNRMKMFFYLKKNNWGDLIFDGNSARLDRNLHTLKNLSQYDTQLLKNYKNNLIALKIAQQNLQETFKSLEENIHQLQAQQNNLLSAEVDYLSQIKKTKTESLLTQKQNLNRPINQLPVAGFGSVLDQNNQYYLVSNGETYAGFIKSPVRTVGLGRVIFRDLMPRWKDTLIVEHADHYFSVYAGLKSIEKNVGDRVEKGDLLGHAEGEFYFELRHYSTPINPEKWYQRKEGAL